MTPDSERDQRLRICLGSSLTSYKIIPDLVSDRTLESLQCDLNSPRTTMVGVPGRSRACQPCKKRRVACDLQQPICARCVKAKRTCEYGNSRIFVLNDEGSHKTMYRKKDGVLASSDRRDSLNSKDGTRCEVTTLDEADPFSPAVTQALLLYKPPLDGMLKQQALLANALFGDIVYNNPTLDGLTYSLTNALENCCLRTPLLACYTGWLARRFHNRRMKDAGRQFYIQALKDTHTALMAPQTAYDDSTLAACTALGIYEALECPGGTKAAYMWHRAASYRLIKMRGPEAHQDGPAHRLFVDFRFFGVLHAFDNGHDTFLSSPEWTTIPFSIHPKTKFDELVDLFALGPEISAMGNSLATLPKDQVFPTALAILGKLSVHKQKLQAYYNELEATYPTPLYWERVSPTRDDMVGSDNEFVFPPSIWFQDLDTAAILMLYWAIFTLVWAGLTDLYSLFDEHGLAHLFGVAMGGEPGEFTPESMQFLCIDRARKVLQSVAYCTTSRALECGPPRGMTQLAIVTDVLKRSKGCEAEYRWALKARRRIGAKWIRLFQASDI